MIENTPTAVSHEDQASSPEIVWGKNPNTCSSAVLVLGQTVEEEKNKQVMNC